jgi:hypothetical protein
MATRSGLGTSYNSSAISVSDGTLEIQGQTVTAINLSANTTLKTNSERHIISANLFRTDIKDLGDILTNPLTENLNMDGFNIDNNPQITSLEQKTQFIITNEEFKETQFSGGILLNGNITNASDVIFENGASINGVETDLSISVPGIGSILMNNNLLSTANITGANISTNGVINGQIVGIGNAQPFQTGYNFPVARPLIAGQVMVTPTSSSNTLQFRSANLDGILNQSSILGISTTIAHALILGSPTYQMPTARGTNNQYIKTDGAGLCSFATFQTPTYGQIGRQLLETVGYSLTANIFSSASTLGGTMDTTFPNSANITPNSASGTITYTELSTKVLVVELDLRARVGDGKNATGLITLNLISGTSTILAYDIARVANTTERVHLSCKIVQPVATGTVFSFSIGYDNNLTNNLFLSSISLSIYGAGF